MGVNLANSRFFPKGIDNHFRADRPGSKTGRWVQMLGCFQARKNGMLEVMDQPEFLRLFQEAEAKLAKGRELSPREKHILLTGMLLGRETRQERKYGQT
jgi:hypothetical protein